MEIGEIKGDTAYTLFDVKYDSRTDELGVNLVRRDGQWAVYHIVMLSR